MRVLITSDLHGSADALKRFMPMAKEADLLLFAGDLTDFGGATEARALVGLFAGERSRLVAVPGNCDKRGARDLLCAEGLSADGLAIERGGTLVIGSGGALRWTGMTPYERGDPDLALSLYKALEVCASAPDAPLIVLTHQPPKDSGADVRKGASVGSEALSEALDRIRPLLWVCGHIHESPGALFVGGTLVVNPGSLREGRYAEVDIERDESGAWRAAANLWRL
jgi:uncharacterized protein